MNPVSPSSVEFSLPGLEDPGRYMFQTRYLDQMTGQYTNWVTSSVADRTDSQPFEVAISGLMPGTIHRGRYMFSSSTGGREPEMSEEVSFRTPDLCK